MQTDQYEARFRLERQNLDLDTGDHAETIDTIDAPERRSPGREEAAPAPNPSVPTEPVDTEADEARVYRAAQLADFGFPDDGLVGATLYAANVLTRRLSLSTARKRIERDLGPARAAFNEALLPLGKALCAMQEDRALEPLAPMFEAIEAARRMARDKDTVREQLRASSATVQKELSESHGQSESAASRIRARESELAAQEAQLRTKLKRAQALVERCDIELRAMQNAATPPDPSKLQECLERKGQRVIEADALQNSLTELLAELGDARRSLASARGVLSDLESKQRAQNAQHKKVDGKHAKHAAKAHSRLEGAMVDLAIAALEKNLADLTSAEGQQVERARERMEQIQNDVTRYTDAEDAYDREAFGLGVKVLGALGVALLAALYLLAT